MFQITVSKLYQLKLLIMDCHVQYMDPDEEFEMMYAEEMEMMNELSQGKSSVSSYYQNCIKTISVSYIIS